MLQSSNVQHNLITIETQATSTESTDTLFKSPSALSSLLFREGSARWHHPPSNSWLQDLKSGRKCHIRGVVNLCKCDSAVALAPTLKIAFSLASDTIRPGRKYAMTVNKVSGKWMWAAWVPSFGSVSQTEGQVWREPQSISDGRVSWTVDSVATINLVE